MGPIKYSKWLSFDCALFELLGVQEGPEMNRTHIPGHDMDNIHVPYKYTLTSLNLLMVSLP